MDKRRTAPPTPSPGTPTAAAAALRLSSLPPTTPSAHPPHSLSQPPPQVIRTTTLPSPEIFDILAPLHELLSRLATSSSSATSNTPAAAATVGSYKSAAPLEIQHLAAEASTVRNRIRRARRAVEGLPDVERGLSAQEREIAELRTRIEAQMGVLRGVGGAESA